MIRTLALAALTASAVVLAGCASGAAAPGRSASSAPSSAAAEPVTITVLAAASLTDSFQAIADQFESDNPGVTVTLSFGGSSGLAEQILQGVPADVFAAASPATMKTVTDGGGIETDPVDFAANTLEIAVPPGNPGGITGLADFARPDLAIALCAVEVPCGAAAQKVFDATGITAAPDTLEQDVKSVLTKVQLDEVDAGLVYKTDVIAAGDAVEGVEFPEAAEASTAYPIAVLSGSTHQDVAQKFVDFVLGAGQKVLQDAGFDAP